MDEKFSQLIKKLEDSSRRQNAIYDLMRLQDSRAEAYFIKIALDDTISISDRSTAIGGLWDSDSKEAVQALRKILETSESIELIVTAFECLGLLRDTQSGASIINYVSSSYREGIRYMAAQALGRMAYVPATPYLQRMVKEDSPVIRHYACQALINIIRTLDQDNEIYDSILSDLKGLLNDPSKIINSYVQLFLDNIDDHDK